MQSYVVQMGDTLYGISKQFGVSVEDIKLTNDLVSNIISVGQVLMIPTTETTFLYIVKMGDTLYSISREYNISVLELKSINGLVGDNLSIGQELRIPLNGNSSNRDYVIYTVKVGDNLYRIAKNYNVSVDEIRMINSLSSDLLSVGQKLKIPVDIGEEDIKYSTYVVRSGDTLYSIARKFGMSVSNLMAVNNLEDTNLQIGQVLKVEESSNDLEIGLGLSCYGEGYKEPSYLIYTVKKGDNLYNIARRYGVSVDSIMKLNNLNSSNLSIGEKLKIKEV